MSERDFVYWLQGYFELSNTKQLDEAQINMIKQHLDLVLNKVTNSITIVNPGNADSSTGSITLDTTSGFTQGSFVNNTNTQRVIPNNSNLTMFECDRLGRNKTTGETYC